jgi:flagellar motor switch protein FliG
LTTLQKTALLLLAIGQVSAPAVLAGALKQPV